MAENIGFVSTRFAGTDGVSLESAKWAEVFWEDRHISFWYAGQLDRAREISLLVPEAYFGHPDNEWINRQLWGRTRRTTEVSRRIRDLAEHLKGTLYEFVDRFDITRLVVQNALTIPMHVPLGVAIIEFLMETKIPTICHHHDFYWERERFQISPIADYLEMAFPPRLPEMQHVVINQAAREELAWRKGLSSVLIPNVLNFDRPPPGIDDYNADIRQELGLSEEDILVLQPTRVVPRKGIEHAITLLRRLNDPRCKLILSHGVGDEGMEYFNRLMDLARDEGVDVRYFGDRVEDKRRLDEHGHKIYTLDDLYPHADLVTYPSLYEGFGNAFLEAVYHRKPIMVNRYSVFARDIEPKGFRVPAMDGFVDRHVVEEVRRVLDDADYRWQMVDHNFALAREYYSYPVLRYGLQTLMSNFIHAM
ncbi:mannosylglucosylglycerate synthase [Methylomarinovum tepidoasis]|uniref:Mannosylglucosylglycerate synthase n=1 Tax=Methylomarinovum tepidoasis TaxID=2840183 RepID=A0AAU9BWF3_9GAMM|nr:glycosyltransferase family 4 protein [Methylomarinovum sp. IN45]BCX87733.1 mannosylglucosylglycerate synthase [Methylomarinovum sp. IN45]